MAHKAPVYRERIYLLCLKYLPSCAKKQRRGPHGQFWPRQHETIIVVASCSCTRRRRKITAEGAATANKAEHSWTRCGRQKKRREKNKTKQNRTEQNLPRVATIEIALVASCSCSIAIAIFATLHSNFIIIAWQCIDASTLPQHFSSFSAGTFPTFHPPLLPLLPLPVVLPASSGFFPLWFVAFSRAFFKRFTLQSVAANAACFSCLYYSVCGSISCWRVIYVVQSGKGTEFLVGILADIWHEH